jgi:pilus assembly protein Flp/PilA
VIDLKGEIKNAKNGSSHAISGVPQFSLGNLKDGERTQVNTLLLKLYVKFQDLASREEGQDLVEYALVVALIAFGATAGMGRLATAINTAFSNVSSQLGAAIS